MNVTIISFTLLITLLAVSVTSAAGHKKRSLKGKKGKGSSSKDDTPPLYAKIETLNDEDYQKLSGWVSLKYSDDDDDDVTVDYEVNNGPENCDTCKVVVYDGTSCDDLDDDPFYDTEENPWNYDNTSYVTNKKGNAAGFFKTNHGYSSKKSQCKFILVLFDEDDDDDRRRLMSTTTTTISSKKKKRVLKEGKKKKKKDKGPKKIGCGQLVPEPDDSSLLGQFDFHPMMDSWDNDIQQIDFDYINRHEQLAEICLNDPKCKGFNSNGWMKHTIRPKSEWTQWTTSPNLGLYVKKQNVCE